LGLTTNVIEYYKLSQWGKVMNKKDRIAVAVTFIYFLLPLAMLGDRYAESKDIAGVLILLVVYWAYRFIKNDISFLNIKDVD
jgi:hypothetical protein